MTFNIGLLGREAKYFLDAFTKDAIGTKDAHDLSSCRFEILHDHTEISSAFDLVFCTSYTKLIPALYLQSPRHGVFVNHSTDLPKGRGWAPVQWSVLNGLSEITVTLFKAENDDKADTGPWADKETYPIEPHDSLPKLYEKDRALSVRLFTRLIKRIQNGELILHPQQGEASSYRKRTKADSELDTSQALGKLWDHIRICDNQDYPAFFKINGHKVYLRYEVVEDE